MTEHLTGEKNRYLVTVITESGCSIKDGEYSIYISKLLNGWVGEDDYELVDECIDEAIHQNQLVLPEEGCTDLTLQESGEWEDVFWHKYYVIEAQP